LSKNGSFFKQIVFKTLKTLLSGEQNTRKVLPKSYQKENIVFFGETENILTRHNNFKTANKMNKKRKLDAVEFGTSVRGQYIMGQALAYAIRHIESQPEKEQEISNMEDMRFLGESLFQPFFEIHFNEKAKKDWKDDILASYDKKTSQNFSKQIGDE
jgi:hypothetical protein